MNRGKKFESIIGEALNNIKDSYCIDLYDQMGYTNYPSDYIFYKDGMFYCIECKSHQRASIPFNCISDNQWKYMEDAIAVSGVNAYVIVWFVDKDVTKLYNFEDLLALKNQGVKSIRFDSDKGIIVPAVKKRTYFDYDLGELLC